MSLERSSPQQVGSIVVFSDDWGRHPSSCQHLVRNLLDRYPVLWVNTIGTRAPRLDTQTLKRAGEKLLQWGSTRLGKRNPQAAGNTAGQSTAVAPKQRNLTVVNPKMWPWFGSDRDRRLNRWLLSKQLSPLIEQLPKPVVALTTLPITADLPKTLPVARWVYYCVDDFSQWPGLDGDTLRRMDHDMIQRADSLVAVSENLQKMIANDGRSSALLTHGVDVEFWNTQRRLSARCDAATRRAEGNRLMLNGARKSELNGRVSLAVLDAGDGGQQSVAISEHSRDRMASEPPSRDTSDSAEELLKGLQGPLIVFWGVIDRRMDSPSIRQLSDDLIEGTIVLIGPQQDPDPSLLSLSNVRTCPAQPLNALPSIADRADVLIMPYADLPVTRAMQPLKLKEYLATGKAVVVNRLPSTDAWCDCLDVAESPAEFSQLVRQRIYSGIPVLQSLARCRLQQESWKTKTERLEHILKSDTPSATLPDGRPQVLNCASTGPLRCS
jgi:hypothetical protein